MDRKSRQNPLAYSGVEVDAPLGSSTPKQGEDVTVTDKKRPIPLLQRLLHSDIIGDASTYAEEWGSHFDFMYPLTNDRKMWVEQLAQKVFYWTGIADLYRRARHRRGATIQMYHSVSGPEESRWIDPRFTIPPQEFEAQVRFLAAHRNVVPFSGLVDMLERGENPPAGTVVITFDDGYLDTLRVAAPILEKYGLPAIVFLVTGYIDRAQNQWGDELFSLFVSHTRTNVSLPEIGQPTVDLRDARAKAGAYSALLSWFISALPGARTQMLARLADEFRPKCKAPRLTMNWEEVRELTLKISRHRDRPAQRGTPGHDGPRWGHGRK